MQGLEKLVGAAGWCGWERWQVQMQAHHHHQFLVQPGRGGGGREGRQSVCSWAKVQVGGPECAGEVSMGSAAAARGRARLEARA